MSSLFIDVDSQLDFLYPAGALYVTGAERILPRIAELNRHAAHNGIPVLSTVDAHTEDDPEFKIWPKHCVAGALGQHKAASTLLPKRVVVPNREGGFAIDGAQQIVVEKQTIDIFQTHTFARLIERFNPASFVVYGVVTEICVLYVVRGLLRMGKAVTVVPNAIKSLTDAAGDAAIAEMRADGARFDS